jgi:hypothetical protein
MIKELRQFSNRGISCLSSASVFVLTLTLSVLFGSVVPVLAQTPASSPPQSLIEEIKALAQNDVEDEIPRRTDFIVKLYSNNSQALTSPKIRATYDDEYSKKAKEKGSRELLKNSAILLIILLSVLAVAWLMRKKNPATLKKVSVSLPFGIGTVEWEVDPIESRVAWSLYVELVTRTAIQPLKSDQGLLRETLKSLYSLFGTTRQILKEARPIVGASPKSVGGIAIAVLNNGLRPFLSKWHPSLEEWEAQRPSTTSGRQHEKDWSEEPQLRSELELLTQDLQKYAEALAKIAGIQNDN